MSRPPGNVRERFESKVVRADGCWRWLSTTQWFGYGVMKIAGKLRTAHRVSYEMFVGPIPTGMCVLHRCDNPPCCNPEHLFIGTFKDNTQDMFAKGRQAMLRGSAVPGAKLTEDIIRAIRAEDARGVASKLIAVRYGVPYGQVRAIVVGDRWAHVGGVTRVRAVSRKLDSEQADEIRMFYARGNVTQKYLAELYGVGGPLISRIITGKAHRALPRTAPGRAPAATRS